LLLRSLRGRTLLVTVIGIIACECVTFAVLGIYRHSLLAGRARDFVSGQVQMVRSSLTHASPEQVAAELDAPPGQRRGRRMLLPRDGGRESAPLLQPRSDAANDADPTSSAPDDRGARPPPDRARGPDDYPGGGFVGPGVRGAHMRLLQTLPANATQQEPPDLSLPQVVTALRDEYGDDALRFTDEPEPAVWVRMPSVGWWLMLPFSRYASPSIPWPILFATLAAVTLMGAIVGLYAFRLAQPLRALSQAAANYEIGQRPELPLTGPDEIRAVTKQFNAMAERLERDDAERRVMLAGLPHDLRAPLARAKLRLELMDDGPDSPKTGLQRDLTEVGSIADQFVAYLRGLDRDTGSFKPTALHELVRDRGLVWRESGHDVTIERADVLNRDADADALMRAIDNLIGNAFAHGGAPVSIAGISASGGSKATYRIVVRDHGPGIPAARRAEALKPFTRLDAARGASGHCGLGLAVAQSVARLHGGRIELDEATGGGLAAAIVLPATALSKV
jgi:two-component system osmolarity sensor histidine kinase EnvZ